MVDRVGIKTLREVIEIEHVLQENAFTLEQFVKWADSATARAAAWKIELDQRGWVYRENTKSWAFNFDDIRNTSNVNDAYDRAMKGI